MKFVFSDSQTGQNGCWPAADACLAAENERIMTWIFHLELKTLEIHLLSARAVLVHTSRPLCLHSALPCWFTLSDKSQEEGSNLGKLGQSKTQERLILKLKEQNKIHNSRDTTKIIVDTQFLAENEAGLFFSIVLLRLPLNFQTFKGLSSRHIYLDKCFESQFT